MKLKPFQYCWLIDCLFFLGSYVLNDKSALDIQLYDSYYVISYYYIFRWVALVLGVVGLVLWLSTRFFNT